MTEYTISRLSFDKSVVDTGLLGVFDKGSELMLRYKDSQFDITSHHLFTIIALEQLRLQLESEGYLLNCTGCRLDTSYRTVGGQTGLLTYLISDGQQARKTVEIFKPTDALDKVCSVREHKAYYEKWYNSL